MKACFSVLSVCPYGLLHGRRTGRECADILCRVTTRSPWKCRVSARRLATTASVIQPIRTDPSVRRHSKMATLISTALSTSRATQWSVDVTPHSLTAEHPAAAKLP